MPKTSIDEDRQSLSGEYEVRPPKHSRMSTPATDAYLLKQSFQTQLCRKIIAALYARHDLRPLLLIEYVHYDFARSPLANKRAVAAAKRGGTASPIISAMRYLPSAALNL